MKWGSTIRGTAPKGMSTSKKIERYERGGDDNNANEGIEKAEDLPRDWGKNPTWFILRARIRGFRVEIKELLSNTELATRHGMSRS